MKKGKRAETKTERVVLEARGETDNGEKGEVCLDIQNWLCKLVVQAQPLPAPVRDSGQGKGVPCSAGAGAGADAPSRLLSSSSSTYYRQVLPKIPLTPPAQCPLECPPTIRNANVMLPRIFLGLDCIIC